MADELDKKTPTDPEALGIEVGGDEPSAYSFGLDETVREPLAQTPLDLLGETPLDPRGEPASDQTAGGCPQSTRPELLEDAQTIEEVPIHDRPRTAFTGASTGPDDLDITAPTVQGGETEMPTPVGGRGADGRGRVRRSGEELERTEIVDRAARLVMSDDESSVVTVLSRPAGRGAAGWIVAVAVLSAATIAVAWFYFVVVEPLRSEVEALRVELVDSQAREGEARGQLRDLAASRSQLEAATEALNKRVEEQEGERDTEQREAEAADAERRREDEAGDAGQRAKKKRKKRRR